MSHTVSLLICGRVFWHRQANSEQKLQRRAMDLNNVFLISYNWTPSSGSFLSTKMRHGFWHCFKWVMFRPEFWFGYVCLGKCEYTLRSSWLLIHNQMHAKEHIKITENALYANPQKYAKRNTQKRLLRKTTPKPNWDLLSFCMIM